MNIVERKTSREVYVAARKVGCSELQATIIGNRIQKGDPDNISSIIHGGLEVIPHPELLADSDKAALRILQALENKELIGGLFDYDVDGCTSGAICQTALVSHFNHPAERFVRYIGNRFVDGYGVSSSMVERILAEPIKPSLIITADCGSSDEPNIKRLAENGIDVIVTDHHEIPDIGIPLSAYAVVNPTRTDCSYPDKSIAGCAVIWLLLSYVRGHLVSQNTDNSKIPKLGSLLDYVALGTVADCVSLASPLNRAFIKTGLTLINKQTRPCWAIAKKELAGEAPDFNETDLGYRIGPRINARSRIDDANMAAQFLVSMDFAEVQACFNAMNNDNETRKDIEKEMKTVAFKQVRSCSAKFVAVSYHESFHEGVQGIVASRLTEEFGRPAAVLSPTDDPEVYKGSARSIPSIDLNLVFTEMRRLQSDIFISGGGHKAAQGFNIKRDQIPLFKSIFDRIVGDAVNGKQLAAEGYADGSLFALTVNAEQAMQEIKACGPFGQLFESPVFHDKAFVKSSRVIGKENPVHLSIMLLFPNGLEMRAVWFNALEKAGNPSPIQEGSHYEFLYSLTENHFRGNTTVQAHIQSARPCNE